MPKTVIALPPRGRQHGQENETFPDIVLFETRCFRASLHSTAELIAAPASLGSHHERSRKEEANMNIAIRPAVPADAEACGRIIYEVFQGIAERHGFPPHFPSVEVAIQCANFCISIPRYSAWSQRPTGKSLAPTSLTSVIVSWSWNGYCRSAGSGTRHRAAPDGNRESTELSEGYGKCSADCAATTRSGGSPPFMVTQ